MLLATKATHFIGLGNPANRSTASPKRSAPSSGNHTTTSRRHEVGAPDAPKSATMVALAIRLLVCGLGTEYLCASGEGLSRCTCHHRNRPPLLRRISVRR